LPIRMLGPLRLLFLIEQERAEDQVIDMRAHETPIGVLGRTDDRLSPHIERGVYDDGTPGELLERSDEIIVVRVRLPSPFGHAPSSQCGLRQGCPTAGR